MKEEEKLGISKQQQLKHNKKPKISTFGKTKSFIKKKSAKNIVTKEEQDYLDWLHQGYHLRCMICNTQSKIEFHHVKNRSSDKKNHLRLIPLCYMHHRISNDISAHGTPKKFREIYPYENQLILAASIHLKYLNDNT